MHTTTTTTTTTTNNNNNNNIGHKLFKMMSILKEYT